MDPLTGKQLGTLQHSIEVEHIALSQVGDLSRRRLVLVDKNRDLYISPVQGAQELYKLHIMVDAMRWNDCNNSLAAVADGLLLVWYYPEVIYMDRDLLSSTISKQPAFDWGKTAEIVEFRDTRVQIRRSDGALVSASVSPYPTILEKFCAASEWEPALRLCRCALRHAVSHSIQSLGSDADMSRVSSCGHALRLWRSLAKSSTRLRSLMRRSTKSTSCFTCVTSRNFLQLKHVKQNCCSSAEDRWKLCKFWSKVDGCIEQ
mmetsp:Transcript_14239/g.37653  ORF Transcript_14239/g.37653 Transcript_14239/m.37653 type:complete len:260 (-) Transcript_14239:612-1391(-)